MTDAELRERYPALWLMTCCLDELDELIDTRDLPTREPQIFALMTEFDEPRIRARARAELEQLIRTVSAGVS